MIKPKYTRKQEDIMYPEKSTHDEFMLSKGLHKDPKKNFKVVNGKIVSNPCRKKNKSQSMP